MISEDIIMKKLGEIKQELDYIKEHMVYADPFEHEHEEVEEVHKGFEELESIAPRLKRK